MASRPDRDMFGHPVHRQGVRTANDSYYTPQGLANALTLAWRSRARGCRVGAVLEPSVGGGAWLRPVRRVWPNATIGAVDVDPTAPGLHIGIADRIGIGDFATREPPVRPDLTIGNPPFLAAVEHVERALEIGRHCAFLLRAGFLGSADRRPFFERFPLRHVWFIPERPSFTGQGTDQYTYAFFWWDAEYRGESTFSFCPRWR